MAVMAVVIVVVVVKVIVVVIAKVLALAAATIGIDALVEVFLGVLADKVTVLRFAAPVS